MTKSEENKAKMLKLGLLGLSALLVCVGLFGCDQKSKPSTTPVENTPSVKKSPNEMPGSTPIPKVAIPAAPSSSVPALPPEDSTSSPTK